MKTARLLISSVFLVLFIILFGWCFYYFQINVSEIIHNIILWILLIPFLFANAKWYFKQNEPDIKKGFLLGVVWVTSIILLELVLGNVIFGLISCIIFFEVFILAVLFGFEFDSTYSAPEKKT